MTPFYGTRPDLVAKMMHQMAAFWRTDVIQAAGIGKTQAHRLRLVRREERKQDEGETDGNLGNVG